MSGLEDLFAAARVAQQQAYAPYSHFPVGAALRADSGVVFSGCNVENAAYPLGVCAETAAIAAMIAAGERRIAEILVVGPGRKKIAPCGACRQRIAEFGAGALVHLADDRGAVETFSLADLLPRAFGPESLKA